ncbi:MAG: hypothetical protein RSE54_04065 [Ruthenibacterium sp.]
MNCADAWNARLDAQCRMAEMLSCGGYGTYAEREPVCEICGARLSCGDLLYDGHAGNRHAALGCGECCAIDDAGNLIDAQTRDVLASAGEFEQIEIRE